MRGKTQVEVVMECNIRARTRLDYPAWVPCATSTPLRKPLMTLNNAEIVDKYKKCDDTPHKAVCRALAIETAEGKRPPEKRTKNVGKKKLNKNSRTLHCLDDDDDDDDSEDEKTDIQTKKDLIIKLSSSQLNKRSVRKKRPLMETGPSPSEQGKVIGKQGPLKSDTGSDKEIEKCNGNKTSISLQQKENSKESTCDAEVKETSKNIIISDVNTSHNNKNIKNEKKLKKLAHIQEKLSNNINKCETNGTASQKRKNKASKTSHAKRLKTESTFPTSIGNIDEKKKAKLRNKSKHCEKIGKVAEIKQESPARLSASHEIFSETKEKEFRDSLDLTAADHEELAVAYLNVNNVPTKQKAKWKCSNSRQSIKSEPLKNVPVSDNSLLSRPKRLKKSPKQFWLPKSETNCEPSLENNSDAEKVKNVKDDSQVISSTQKSDEPDGMAIKVSTSSDAGGSDLPSDPVYIKTISELDFIENCSEDENKKFSVAVGWQFSTFKCCALKIGAKCEASAKTKSSNSHFGGVILKGRISMKIGETEVKMKEGQMFCVPPSTDWKAINIGRIDCVLYYWVGKL